MDRLMMSQARKELKNIHYIGNQNNEPAIKTYRIIFKEYLIY